jgi:hypothetical protein
MGLSYAIHEHVSSLHSYSWEPRIHGNLAPRHCSNPLATLFVVWDLLGLPCAMGLLPRLLCGLYWACLVRCILVWVISFMGTLHCVIVQTHWQLSLLGLFPRSLRGLCKYICTLSLVASTAKGTFITLPHITIGSHTICWGNNILGSL